MAFCGGGRHMSPIQAAVAGSAYPPRAQLNFDPPFFLNLIAPALLLSLLKKWTTLIAPAYGVYFTAEAVTILYAYFALARSVYVYNNSRDREGRYDSHRAVLARQLQRASLYCRCSDGRCDQRGLPGPLASSRSAEQRHA
jgi:hypothetical protein